MQPLQWLQCHYKTLKPNKRQKGLLSQEYHQHGNKKVLHLHLYTAQCICEGDVNRGKLENPVCNKKTSLKYQTSILSLSASCFLCPFIVHSTLNENVVQLRDSEHLQVHFHACYTSAWLHICKQGCHIHTFYFQEGKLTKTVSMQNHPQQG